MTYNLTLWGGYQIALPFSSKPLYTCLSNSLFSETSLCRRTPRTYSTLLGEWNSRSPHGHYDPYRWPLYHYSVLQWLRSAGGTSMFNRGTHYAICPGSWIRTGPSAGFNVEERGWQWLQSLGNDDTHGFTMGQMLLAIPPLQWGTGSLEIGHATGLEQLQKR